MKSALSLLGERQQSLLTTLLHHRKGLTVEELSGLLAISRNAVNQHLTHLSGSGFIQSSLQESTGGRPGKVYTLTPNGLELFQRRYSFLAKLLLSWIDKNMGERELDTCLTELGKEMANGLEHRITQYSSYNDRLQEAVTIMSELGYDTKLHQLSENQAEIVANNCVYQELAQQHSEFCQLDISFLKHLLKADIEHTECIVRGGKHCRFKITGTKESRSR
ncbi:MULTISPECIES: helix-turn-helix transcriptional regulator [Nitrosomonas]|uniref:Transcriptional regulator n=2 Tax=Nitrosomonas eutropha TaxID=916 RepID=A0ABX5M9B9_9PROT|nr:MULTISPECIES: methanogen output domain 1-containing protein [Nitrosomonas]ABI60323.1 transcriptional regulator [Nitrosomonas eutropha C91]MXS80459.1 HTH domain-containing protein [Nitrosomonas sp. GH22]PXV83727.1 transcriptional regulator [Nitrosomonas eutropha]SCX17094.1 transcriptional regulator [Nitrosomonas eutropha]SDW52439.1 transcriptional regulator [Nitrosomonas eutropha]